MDVVNLKDEIKLLEESTLPKLEAALNRILDRLLEGPITITINLRGEHNEKSTDSALPAPCHEPPGPGADGPGKTIA